MRLAYLDCSRGVSGVAALAALLDAGADLDHLSKELRFLDGGGGGPILRAEDVMDGVFRARCVSVPGGSATVGRNLTELEARLSGAGLPDAARDLAIDVYRRLAEAEARVHGSSPKAVRFHEVGSLRSVVGVVGTALAISSLGIERVVASPLPFGSGTVETEHGPLPIPAPATLELVRGMPVEPHEGTGELVTPTGAAILAATAASFGPMPAMTIEDVGYGADVRRAELVLRVILGWTSGG